MSTRFHPRGGNIVSRTAQAVPSVTNTVRSLLVQSCCSNAKSPLVQNCWSDTKPAFLLIRCQASPDARRSCAESWCRPCGRKRTAVLYIHRYCRHLRPPQTSNEPDSCLDRHLASSLHKTPLMPGDHAQWSQWQWRRPWRYAQRLRAMAAMRVRATIPRDGGDDTCSDYA